MKRKLAFLLLTFLFGLQCMVAQNIRVAGVVVSQEDGEPVIGASIMVKGTTQGTITNYDGEFNLSADRNARLIVSYVGMVTQELPVQANMRIVLAPNTQALDEVVVVAYGQQRKEAVTGAVVNIKSEAIERRPIAVATAALEGQAPGVQVSSSYGEPGSAPEIRIRGFSSINGTNAPLYVINGIPMGGTVEGSGSGSASRSNPLADLNPADIESITVLKDASSAALYGNKAANGVVLVTTKAGRLGEDNVDIQVSVNQGIYSRGIKEYERLNAKQYMETYWQARRNALYTDDQAKASPVYGTWNDANAAALSVVKSGLGENYNIFNKSWEELYDANGKLVSGAEILSGYAGDLDWFEPLERNGQRSEYSFSARGGSKKSTYYASVGYLNEEGFTKRSNSERLTANTKIDFTPTSWFKGGVALNGSLQEYNRMSGSAIDNATSYINPFFFARNMAPVYPVHMHDDKGNYLLDENGEKQYDGGGSSRPQYNNRHIIWETDLDRDKTKRITLDGTAYADITFLKDFVLTVKGNMNTRNSVQRTYNNSVIGDGAGQGRMRHESYDYKNYLFQQLLNWRRSFNEVHNVEVLFGHENYSYKYDFMYLYKTDEKFAGIMELSNFTTQSSTNGSQSGYKNEGYFSRIGYNYDQKYFGEFSFRRDGSSRFYKDHRWGNFWSLGGSWIMSDEEFIKSYDWIDYLKFRAAYGQTGNDAGIGYYQWMALYTSTQNGGDGAYWKSQLAAEDLTWENNKSFSLALEGNLFRRINFSVEYYDKKSQDLLFDVDLPTSMGGIGTGVTSPSITKNFGSVSNRGLEIALDGDIVRTKDWTWNLGAQFNTLTNVINELPEEYGKEGHISGTKKYMEGSSIYEFWLYKYAGVDKSNGRSLYQFDNENYYVEEIGQNGDNQTKVAKGNYTVIDGVAYSYKTTYAKKDWSGTSIPKIFGSFSTNLRYKDFQLSALLTYQLGGKALDYTYSSLMGLVATPSATHVDVLKSWMPDQASTGIDPAGIPAMNTSQSSDNNATSDRFLISTNYLNVKNIALSYNVPKKILAPIGLKALMLSASADNVCLFTKRQGMNPQQSWNGIIDNGYMPARVFTFGLNVKF